MTTASDIYQLGLLLRVLLCGVPGGGASGREQRMSVALGACRKESPDAAHVIADARAVDVGRLRRQLSGDLDTIVHRATEYDPADRYPTAETLSDDLRCWLGNRPLRGLRVPLHLSAWKFFQRNRGAVTVTFALAIGLLMTTGIALERARQERVQREAVQVEIARMVAIRDYLQLMFRDSRQGDGDQVREVLRRSAFRLAEQFRQDPDGGQSAALFLAELYVNMGDHVAARPLIDKVLAWPGVGEQRPELLAQAYLYKAQIEQVAGNLDAGFVALENARRLSAKVPDRSASLLNESKITQARLERAAGRVDASITLLRGAIDERREQLQLDDHDLASARSELCNSLVQAGAGDAEPACSDAMAAFERLGMGDSVMGMGVRNALAVFYARQQQPAKAEVQFRQLLADRERLYGSESADFGIILLNLGSVLALQGKHADALPKQTRALDILRRQGDPEGAQVLSAALKLAETLAALQRHDDARIHVASVADALQARPALEPMLGGALAISRLRLAVSSGNAEESRRRLLEAEQKLPAAQSAVLDALREEIKALSGHSPFGGPAGG